jgi:L-alanine-DL-glutamate epimerase-like enolase superfamily enzyme
LKITHICTTLVQIPLERPMITAIHETRSLGCVLVYLETDEGLTGESYIFSLNSDRLSVFDGMIKSLARHVVGKHPHYVEGMWDAMWRDINPIGHQGIAVSAISAIDCALWDLVGKSAGMPLYKLFGACRDDIKVYASSGLWLSQSIDELVAEADLFLSQGFKAMKIRLGKPRMDEDLERVAAVRAAVGPEVELLVDANQAFTTPYAIKIGRQLEKLDVAWFEEPVLTYNLEGHAAVAAALDMPIATGETEYNRYAMRAMLEARAADVLMPDMQRIGGYSEFRRVASLASAFHIPVSTHIFPEQSLSIAGSCVNCISVEHVSWFSPLYREKMQIVDGKIAMSPRPGIGFTFDPQAVDKFRVQ